MKVGIDAGRGLVKAVCGSRRVLFPAVVGRSVERRYGKLMGSVDANGRVKIKLTNPEGQVREVDRMVGREAIEQTLSAHADLTRLRQDDDILALMGEALLRLGAAGQEVYLVTGAPVSYYQDVRTKRVILADWDDVQVVDEPLPNVQSLADLSRVREGTRVSVCGRVYEQRGQIITLTDGFQTREVHVPELGEPFYPADPSTNSGQDDATLLWVQGTVARVGRYLDLLRGRWEVNGSAWMVKDVVVVPEAVGVLYSLALSPSGQVVDEALLHDSVAVVDVGQYTTDAVIVKEQRFQEPLSFSVPQGVGMVVRAIHDYLVNEHGMDVAEFKLLDALREGYVMVQGARVDLSDIIKAGAEALADTVLSHVKNRWENESLDRLILAGGGSYYVGQQVRDAFGFGDLLAEAEWANADGFYTYACWNPVWRR